MRFPSKTGALSPVVRVLRGFLNASKRQEQLDRQSHAAFDILLGEFIAARESWIKRQAQDADDFNLIEVLQVADDENRHSMMLAWLLDWRLDHAGTHAQGPLGFQLFLRALELPEDYAATDYWVRREVAGEVSRVDIEIAARGRFIIHLENKIWASEGLNQTNREGTDLEHRARLFGVSKSNMHGLFLTPDASPALNPQFRSISWSMVARVLEEFSQMSKPSEVKLFASHYARALRKFSIAEPKGKDEENVKDLVQ